MSWLFLDTHAPGKTRFALFMNKRVPQVTHVEGHVTGLLPLLEKTLGKKGLKQLEGLCVVAGPGSFSSVRAGVLDANLISRLLNIPLIGVTVDEAHDLPVLSHKILAADHTWRAVEYVAPIYDKEPNITLPKSA